MQVNYINTCILSGCCASSATPLTFSMEDIHICNSVCLRYVDDKKLSFIQPNVIYLKFKNIQKYLNLLSKHSLLLVVSMKIIYILHTNCQNM